MIKGMAYYALIPIIVVYFFFNNALLPTGLLYTTVLTPVFLYWLYKRNKLLVCLKWSLLLILPVPFHLLSGIDPSSYIRSFVLIFTAWVFLFTSFEAVKFISDDLEDIYRKIISINGLLIITALIILPFANLREAMWYSVPISKNISAFPRLDLFAYEPSHYALLLSPVIIFYGLKLVSGRSQHPLLLMLAITIPLVLSLSFGVIGALLISTLIIFSIFNRRLPAKHRRNMIWLFLTMAVSILIIMLLWRTNPVLLRIENIFTGTDTSARGRLFNSFMFAWDLNVQHNLLFGVGPGQVKILAHDLIINYYQYTGEYAEIVRIPNSMAELLAIYGLYGFMLKLFIEIYYMFRLKVYGNLYSLTVFVFIFIYQFTGSFTVNAAEIGLWSIAFFARPDIFSIDKLKHADS